MEIEFSARFRKYYHKVNEKIKIAFRKRLKLFTKDQFHPQLRNHPLTGNFKGYRSINITGDWRAIYSEQTMSGKKVIVFEILGTHSQLYR